MRHAKSLCLSGLLLTLSGSAFGAERYDYLLAQLPSEGRACAAVAAELGQAFEQQSGLTPTRVGCENGRGDVFDVRISYLADARAPGASTYIDATPTLSAGAFASQAECEAGLTAGRSRFLARTGLSPLVAYCFEEQGTLVYPWAQRIEAFGMATQAPSYGGFLLIGQAVGLSDDELQAAVAEGVGAQGFDVSFVALRPEGHLLSVTVQAYGIEQLKLGANVLAATETAPQCEEQLASLRGFFDSAAGSVVSLCVFRDSLNVYEVVAVARGEDWWVQESPERFASYHECVAARAGIVDQARASAGQVIAGGVCGHNTLTGGWLVNLLTRQEG